MALIHHFQTQLRQTIAQVCAANSWPIADISRIALEEPKDVSHGELATNAAMILAKPAGQPPRVLAEAFKTAIAAMPHVANVEIAGAGFINLRMAPAFWHAGLGEVLQGRALGDVAHFGEQKAVNIEYVSANPTGPMHVGHGRGAVFGDVLANVLAATGWNVTREYYINDAGGQIDALARSIHWRFLEALGAVKGEMPEGLYPGDYLQTLAAELLKNSAIQPKADTPLTMPLEAEDTATITKMLSAENEPHWIEQFRVAGIAAMMDLIRDDLAALRVQHDHFFSERALTREGVDKVQAAIDALEAQGHMYVGVLAPPKGEVQAHYNPRPQTLFRATNFGDTEDRALKKDNGEYTYFAADVAYHADKLSRRFARLIDVWGADHAGYVARMKAVVKAMSNDTVPLEIALCQLVRLQRNGEPVRMSKRSGDFVTLREVVDEVGADAVRFMMIYRKADAPLDFDLAKVVEQSKDNPVFYVQYAHARIGSVLRHAAEAGVEIAPVQDVARYAALLTDEAEHALVLALARYPNVVEAAAKTTEVHRIAFYVHDLASKFHSLWAKGNSNASLRFLQADSFEISIARLTLCVCVQQVLREALGLLGVNAPDSM